MDKGGCKEGKKQGKGGCAKGKKKKPKFKVKPSAKEQKELETLKARLLKKGEKKIASRKFNVNPTPLKRRLLKMAWFPASQEERDSVEKRVTPKGTVDLQYNNRFPQYDITGKQHHMIEMSYPVDFDESDYYQRESQLEDGDLRYQLLEEFEGQRFPLKMRYFD